LQKKLAESFKKTARAKERSDPIFSISSKDAKAKKILRLPYLKDRRNFTMQIQTVKEKITKVVLSQPEDATYDEIMRELAFAKMVDDGLEDVRAGRVISNGEMAGRIRAWKK
jgi:hypothetical protein